MPVPDDPGAKPKPLVPALRDAALHDSARRTFVVTGLTVTGGLLLYAFAPTRGRDGTIGAILGIAAVCVVVPLTVRRARSIRASERPILDAVETLVLLFTLLVLGFAAVYVVIAEHSHQLVDVRTKIDALYFTVSTLSTVGFGDAHAAGQAARLVVTVQIVFDLAFLATAVRLLTSVAQRRVAEKGGRG